VEIRVPIKLFLDCILGYKGVSEGGDRPVFMARRRIKEEYGVDFEVIREKVLDGDFKII